MNINEVESFIKKLLSKSSEYNFDDVEVSFGSSASMSVDILDGVVSSYERSSGQNVSLMGKKDGQMSKASTSHFDDAAIEFLLNEVSENITVLDDEDEDFIYCDPDNSDLKYVRTSPYYDKNTYSKFETIGLEIERRILALDPSIQGVDYLSIGCGESTSIVANSKGLYAYTKDDSLSIYAGARATKDEVTKSAGYYWYGDDIDKFDIDAFVAEIGKRLLGKFGARSVPSGTYNVVLSNEATISFILAFFGNFSAYSMQKGISLLAGKEGTKIASDKFNLIEDPFYEKAMYKLPFDHAGVLTSTKSIIDKGIFNTALYTIKSAHMAGKKPTGNNLGSDGFTNLIVVPGTKNFDELVSSVGSGIYITELNGLHAGVNAISGDFSLFCEGYRITDGKIGEPVEQITVSDNFYNVLQKISEVGCDTISEPHGEGEFFCPSIIISDISIAGDAED